MRAFALIVSLAVAALLTASAADRPNLLWITAEDMSADLGCYGDDYARTPVLDAFAARGVRYLNAFATAPVCSPSRSCLITGRYAVTLGTHQMRSAFPLPDSVRAWPALLRAAGYYTTNNVKTDYNTSSERRLIDEAWDESSASAHWRGRDDPHQPFFAVFNDMTTHQSRASVWSYEKFRAQVQSQLPPERIHDPKLAPVPPYYFDNAVSRRTVARYYDCISAMDARTGEILEQLEEDGLADETIVVFFSDHGAGLPRHKRLLHDSGMHVPLLIRFPEKFRHLAPAAPGETLSRLVSFVDFPPTMLSLLGIGIPPGMQGIPFLGSEADGRAPRSYVFGARDRVDEVFDCARSLRDSDYLYIRNYMPHLGWCQPSVYSDQAEILDQFFAAHAPEELTPPIRHFIAPTRPAEELYAVRNDPMQLHNLAGDSAHAAALARMRDALRAQILAARDLGFRTEFHQSEDVPTALLLDAAEMVGETDAAAIARVLANLGSPQPAVRYWAVIALRALSGLPDEASAALRALAARDPSPAVRVEAAVALGDPSVAVGLLDAEDPLTVLHAARSVELAGEPGEETRDALEATLRRWRGRDDTPLALFIRFACEAALGIASSY